MTKVTFPELQMTDNQLFDEALLENQWTILYFYPKDATPGCTLEGQDFRDHYQDFVALNAQIFGVSRDSLKQHQKFKDKHDFPFQLISDEEEKLCNYFEVIKEKKNYGRSYLGIERSTFIISPDLHIAYEWRKVKVKDHVKAVLEKLKSLQV